MWRSGGDDPGTAAQAKVTPGVSRPYSRELHGKDAGSSQAVRCPCGKGGVNPLPSPVQRHWGGHLIPNGNGLCRSSAFPGPGSEQERAQENRPGTAGSSHVLKGEEAQGHGSDLN